MNSIIVSCAVLLLYLATVQECAVGKILLNKSSSFLKSQVKYNSSTELRKNGGISKTDFVCSIKPKISVISYNRDEFLPNETVKTELIDWSEDEDNKVWMAPFAALVQIECLAPFPIKWSFDGPLEPEVLSIDVARVENSKVSDGNLSTSKNCFRLVMKLWTRKRSTGKYKCVGIGNGQIDPKQNLQTTLYLYGEGNGPPFLLYQGKEFNVIQAESSETVVLPCQVVNPTVTPQLFKGNSMVTSLEGSIPYNPQIGFSLNLQKISNPYDQYKCSREGGSVYINVQPPPDFRVTPSNTRVTAIEGKFLVLTCEAIFPISLVGFIDESKVTVIKDDNAPVYKYRVTYDYYLHGEEQSGISCVDLKSRSTLHTWTSAVITSKINEESAIRYDVDTKRFYCFSKTSTSPTVFLAQCNSIMECDLAQKCLSWDAPYKLANGGNTCFSQDKVQRGRNCDEKDIQALTFNKNRGCAYVVNSFTDAGFVKCFLPDNGDKTQVYYFNGVKSGAGVVISNWEEAPINELIDVVVLEPNRTFYTQELIEFECAVSKFIFARGQIFKFELEDGSYTVPEETVRDADDGEDSLIVKTSRLKLNDRRIKKVICISPFWNETRWMNNSMSINVIDSTFPEILDPKTSLFYQSGNNVSINCEATGLPVPKVIWYRNGKLAEYQREGFSSSGRTKIVTLIINPVNPDDAGEYICEATNVAGTKTMNLNLDVFQSKKTLHTALFIGAFGITAFVTIVVILWKKLRKNQALVRRLTEKELIEFHNGDLNALKNIPDGYIRAQYLPYDNQYEIKQENLEIGGEVLGKGAYGIVLKGTLCRNDSRKSVAVKTILSPDVTQFKALLTELKMLTYVGGPGHDNVINLLGAVTRNLRDGNVYVVIEYCRLGDLQAFLKSNRGSFLNQIVNEKVDLNLNFNFNSQQAYQTMEYTMRTTDLIDWSYQISSGMEYLASKKVTHGDLAARNILLNEDRIVKITDFGLSKHLYNGFNYVSHSNPNLPWQHCAPELLQQQSLFSTQSDVWAVGVTLWEVFSLGSDPYQEVTWNWDFRSKLLQGLRLDKPSAANQNIYNVMLKCWKNTPAERISFEELRRYFHRLLHHWAEEETSDDTDDVNVPLRRDI